MITYGECPCGRTATLHYGRCRVCRHRSREAACLAWWLANRNRLPGKALAAA